MAAGPLDVPTALADIDVGGKPGFVSADLMDWARFVAIEGLAIPVAPYRLVDVERAEDCLNWSPDEALPAIRERKGAAKLGWCWAGNRHTWLGHASAAARVLVTPTDPGSRPWPKPSPAPPTRWRSSNSTGSG